MEQAPGDILWKLGYQGDFTLVGGTDPDRLVLRAARTVIRDHEYNGDILIDAV